MNKRKTYKYTVYPCFSNKVGTNVIFGVHLYPNHLKLVPAHAGLNLSSVLYKLMRGVFTIAREACFYKGK